MAFYNRFARAYGGKQIATVVASDIMCGPIEAAFANGELAHSDETDDDFTTGGAHPSSIATGPCPERATGLIGFVGSQGSHDLDEV